MLPLEMRQQIHKELNRWATKELAEKAGVSTQTIVRWYQGLSDNRKIEKLAVSMYAKSRKEREKYLNEAGLL